MLRLLCNSPFNLQGYPLSTTFYVLTGGGYDLVLGVNWLYTLGPILWDLSKQTIRFNWKGQPIQLTRLSPSFANLEGIDESSANQSPNTKALV